MSMGKQPQIVEIEIAAVEGMVERAKGLQTKEGLHGFVWVKTDGGAV